MADDYSAADAAEDTAPAGRRWLNAIEKAEKDLSGFHTRAKKIEAIYAEQRSSELSASRQFAILWANQEVLRPAVYARQPQPVVRRRFSDRDPVGRAVADVLERSATSIFDRSNVDSTLRSARDDYLLVARGTAWVRYEPTFTTQQIGDEEVETLTGETIAYDFVHWSDLVHPKCRRWEDLPWLARRVHLKDKAGEDRFGKEVWEKVKQSYRANPPRDEQGRYASRAEVCIYEIWSKTDRKVIWVAKGHDEVLDEQPPLYDLQGFFPCPKPAYGTLLTDSLIPVPDYVYYQDQAEEINDLTKRIGALADALKLVGFYPAGGEDEITSAIETALSPQVSNKMVPVPSWAAWTEGGGSKGLIQWLPIEAVVQTINACVLLRRQLIDDVYQITGISDILRGQGQASETATAQSIKAQWGGIRIRDRQAEIQRFARDLVRLSCEIIAEKFQPQTLWELSGLSYPTAEQKDQVQAALKQQMQAPAVPGQPPAQPQIPPQVKKLLESPTQEEIVQLMRDDKLRSYRVDIETDSTVEADEQAEKQRRNEFLQAVGGFLSTALPVGQQVPEAVPMLGETLMFTARGYRAGRQLEDVIEQFVQTLSDKASNPPPPEPDPKVVEAQERLKIEQQKTQAEIEDRRERLAMDREKNDSAQRKEDMRFQAEMERTNAERAQMGLPPLPLTDMAAQAEAAQQMTQALPMLAEFMGRGFQQIGAQQQQAVAVIEQRQSMGEAAQAQMAAAIQQMAGAIEAMARQLAAPAMIVRDEEGRAIGVRKGPVTQTVTRAPDGSVTGLQ